MVAADLLAKNLQTLMFGSDSWILIVDVDIHDAEDGVYFLGRVDPV